MEDNNRKLSPFWFVIIGLIVSALIGLAISYSFIGHSQKYIDRWLWKYTVLFYCLTGTYNFWFYFYKNNLPVFIYSLKFILINLLFSLPYYMSLILTEVVTINSILTILPAMIIYLVGGFIWIIAFIIDPDVEEYSYKIIKQFFPILIIVMFLGGVCNLPEIIALFLGSLVILCQSLFLLKKAKEKIKYSIENN